MIVLDNFFDDIIEYPTAVTIGKFDGFHRGHELLLEKIENEGEFIKSSRGLGYRIDVIS